MTDQPISAAASRRRSHDARVQAREAALQMLYALEMGGQTTAEVERWYVQNHPLDAQVRERAGAIVAATDRHREAIHRLLAQHLHGWKPERLSLIDRSLLKLAIAELLMTPAPPIAVEIKEILRLANRFSQPEAAGLLHGVLNAIANDLKTSPATDSK